jgi:hypothetical protein
MTKPIGKKKTESSFVGANKSFAKRPNEPTTTKDHLRRVTLSVLVDASDVDEIRDSMRDVFGNGPFQYGGVSVERVRFLPKRVARYFDEWMRAGQ